MDWIAKYWLEAVFGLVTAGLVAGYKILFDRYKVQQKKQNAIKGGMKALIRDRIIELYNRSIERGYCPIYALENLHALHKEYKILGGNGALDDLMEKAEALPTQPPPEGA